MSAFAQQGGDATGGVGADARAAIARWVAIESAAELLVNAVDNADGRQSSISRMREVADEMQAALNVPEPDTVWMRAQPTPPVAGAVPDEVRAAELWDDLINKDDRNSPEEYPEMAMLTFEEFAAYLKDFAQSQAKGQPAVSPSLPAPGGWEPEQRVTDAACRIIDLWMGGRQDWRKSLDKGDFLESHDWLMAQSLARAALGIATPPVTAGTEG